MRTAAICPTCATYENALCILYNGEYLTNTDIEPLDSVEVALQKINDNLVPVSGAGAPTNSAVYLGQFYVNTTPTQPLVYVGVTTGLGAADWRIVTTVPTIGAPVYADNAAALVGGLVIGQIYRTGDDLKIVHV